MATMRYAVCKYKSTHSKLEFSKKKRHHSAVGICGSDWWVRDKTQVTMNKNPQKVLNEDQAVPNGPRLTSKELKHEHPSRVR